MALGILIGLSLYIVWLGDLGETIFENIMFAPARPLAADVNRCEYRERYANICEDDISREVFFPSQDGKVKVQGLFFPNSDSDKIVLYLHGNGGHIYWRMSRLMKLAEFTNAFGISYRGYGKSFGEPTEQGVYSDARGALNYLQKTLGFAPQDIYIYGHSMGAAVAMEIVQDETFGGVILISPFLSGLAMAQLRKLGWLLGTSRPFDSVSKASKIKDTPALFIHGDADAIVPFDQGYALYKRYAGQKEFKRIRGMGHMMIERRIGDIFWKWIHEFVRGPDSDATALSQAKGAT